LASFVLIKAKEEEQLFPQKLGLFCSIGRQIEGLKKDWA